nr:hypothetical protein [Tanacetum cinerariifolium]
FLIVEISSLSSQRLRIGRCNFRLPSDIQSKEAKLHHTSIRFKIDSKKSVLNLEAFREMLHISPRIPNQPFADLPTEEEVLDFLRFLGHSQDIRYLTDVVSRHQATQQYGAILPIELTTNEIRNSEGTGSKPGVPDVPSDDSEEELSWKSSDDEEVGSHEEGKESNDDSDDGSDKDSEETVKFGVGKDGDDDNDEDDEDDDEEQETSKDDEEQETAKDDEELKETGTGGNDVRESGGESEEEKETSEEEEVSFDPIPRTPEDSEKESDDEEEQESRLSEEASIQEEEDAEELYRDVNINQGRGLQITQSV